MDLPMQFADLTLDADALHTPVGTMPLSEIARAEFVRDVVSDGPGPRTAEPSTPAVVGGAIAGGVLLGAAGAVAGGLLGSTVKEEVAGPPTFRTTSVRVDFETTDLAYSMDIPREQEAEAYRFAEAVRKAVKRSR